MNMFTTSRLVEETLRSPLQELNKLLNGRIVGFDPIFLELENWGSTSKLSNYPPHNVEITSKDDSSTVYNITVAVAGFNKDELKVYLDGKYLVVEGEKIKKSEKDSSEIVHRGIASREFLKKFRLSEDTKVTSVSLANGLLTVELVTNVVSKENKSFEITDG